MEFYEKCKIQGSKSDLIYLNNEYNKKIQEFDEIKIKQRHRKNEYNSKIKQFNEITKKVIETQSKVDLLDLKLSKVKNKQKLILSEINNKFIQELKKTDSTLLELVLNSFNIYTNPNILKKLITDESDFKYFMKNSHNIFSTMIDNNHNFTKIHSQIPNKEVNRIIESNIVIKRIYEYFSFYEEIEFQEFALKESENELNQLLEIEHNYFLQLKNLENEILKYENQHSNISLVLKTIRDITNTNKDKQVSSIQTIDQITHHFNEILNINNKQNTRNSKSIKSNFTVRSDYSDEMNEFINEEDSGKSNENTLQNNCLGNSYDKVIKINNFKPKSNQTLISSSRIKNQFKKRGKNEKRTFGLKSQRIRHYPDIVPCDRLSTLEDEHSKNNNNERSGRNSRLNLRKRIMRVNTNNKINEDETILKFTVENIKPNKQYEKKDTRNGYDDSKNGFAKLREIKKSFRKSLSSTQILKNSVSPTSKKF